MSDLELGYEVGYVDGQSSLVNDIEMILDERQDGDEAIHVLLRIRRLAKAWAPPPQHTERIKAFTAALHKGAAK